jgi:hypothetical protein
MYVTLLAMTAIFLQVSAISTNHWQTGKLLGDIPYNSGLWKKCSKKECDEHLPPDNKEKGYPKNSLEATRAFAILGPVLIVLGLSLMYLQNTNKKLQTVLLVCGALASLISIIIYSAELLKIKLGNTEIHGSPGYSYYLNMAGGVMGLVTVFAFIEM